LDRTNGERALAVNAYILSKSSKAFTFPDKGYFDRFTCIKAERVGASFVLDFFVSFLIKQKMKRMIFLLRIEYLTP